MDSIADKTDYKACQQAFKTLGFTPEQVDAIWRVVGAILHLVGSQILIYRKFNQSHYMKSAFSLFLLYYIHDVESSSCQGTTAKADSMKL